MNRADVLDAMQELILAEGRPPSIQAVATALGKTKQAVLHHFPDRSALEQALARRALERVDDAMTDAARRGCAAETYLWLSVPTGEDRAVALLVLTSLRSDVAALPPGLDEAVARWEALIAAEVGDPVRAQVIRLVADGLFVGALVGPPPSADQVDALVDHLVGDRGRRAPRRTP